MVRSGGVLARETRALSRVPTALYRLVRPIENFSLVVLDVGVIATAWLLGTVAGYEAAVPADARNWIPLVVAVAVVCEITVHRLMRLYGPVWRYASAEEGMRTVAAVVLGSAVATAGVAIVGFVASIDLPLYTMPAVATLIVLLGCGGVRFQARLFSLERISELSDERTRTLVVGSGDEGAALAYELTHTDSGADLELIGFVVDGEQLNGDSVRKIPVLGMTAQLAEICLDHEAELVLVALPHADRDRVRAIVNEVLRTPAQVKVLQRATDRASGLVRNLRDLEIGDLIGREAAPVDSVEIGGVLEGATVLVTGAGGSIGSEIARQVARYEPTHLVLLDRDETLLHEVAVGSLAHAEVVLLDIRDTEGVRRMLERTRPDVIFHAAANKHVPILENHPLEAFTTNVLSTWELARAALASGCERFVHLSTDKAAAPCSVMGASKRVSERLIVGLGRRHGAPYVAVRFGNVLGSRGSVVPTFLRQILDGGPVTVTSEQMTRYFMTIPEAVSLVLQAGAMAHGERTYLLDMGEPASIVGLARQMIRLAGLRPDEDIKIEIVGMRPGERLHERLSDDAEDPAASSHPSILALTSKVIEEWDDLVGFVDELTKAVTAGNERVAVRLVGDMLRRGGIESDLGLDVVDGEVGVAIDVLAVGGDGAAPDLEVHPHAVPVEDREDGALVGLVAEEAGVRVEVEPEDVAEPLGRPPHVAAAQRGDAVLDRHAVT